MIPTPGVVKAPPYRTDTGVPTRTVIGVAGRAQHGKDTIGSVLCEEYGFARVKFADALRDVLLSMDPLILDSAGVPKRLYEVVDDWGWEIAKRNPEIRRLLQCLGVAVRDLVAEDAWVRAAEDRVKQYFAQGMPVVITDVRFPNEARWVWSLVPQGIADCSEMWGVERFNADGSTYEAIPLNHPSESEVLNTLDGKLAAYFMNMGPADRLEKLVRRYMQLRFA